MLSGPRELTLNNALGLELCSADRVLAQRWQLGWRLSCSSQIAHRLLRADGAIGVSCQISSLYWAMVRSDEK